jgi:hypothetical protein
MLKKILLMITEAVLITPLWYIRFKTIANPVERVSLRLDVLSMLHNDAIKDTVAYAEALRSAECAVIMCQCPARRSRTRASTLETNSGP